MISFRSAVNSRAKQKIKPPRMLYSKHARSSPRSAAWMMWSRSRSPARFRFMGLELRFNPMKRNLAGERDLDHIIHAALRGLDRACLEYNIRGGLIFCLAREFTADLNEIIVDKAIRYQHRGVVGIDLAGTEENSLELDPEAVGRFASMFA